MNLADDVLRGAKAIGGFMGLNERAVYHNAANMPLFYQGAIICARKSTLVRWMAEQEKRKRRAAAPRRRTRDTATA